MIPALIQANLSSLSVDNTATAGDAFILAVSTLAWDEDMSNVPKMNVLNHLKSTTSTTPIAEWLIIHRLQPNCAFDGIAIRSHALGSFHGFVPVYSPSTPNVIHHEIALATRPYSNYNSSHQP